MNLDEDHFLATLMGRLSSPPEVTVPPGDDCAAIAWGADRLLLVAVDQVAAGHHYLARDHATPTPPELVGRKLLARNLSDIAAMGGVPRYALAAVAVEPDCPAEWVDAVMQGIESLAGEHAVAMIGGDLGAARADVASLTILGEVEADRVMRRSAACDGDAIAVTGRFGGSLASGRHLTFKPRLREGRWLSERCRCAIDVSDGLLKDLARVAAASGLQAVIEPDRIPRHELNGAPLPLKAALLDGEDYELIVALPGDAADAIVSDWPFEIPLTVIGHWREREPATGPVVSATGDDLGSLAGGTFRHF